MEKGIKVILLIQQNFTRSPSNVEWMIFPQEFSPLKCEILTKRAEKLNEREKITL